jgi:hypothetical protein
MTHRSAYSYQIGLCDNPKCRAIHLDLFDERGEMFAVATIGVESVFPLTETMKNLAYQIVTLKPEDPTTE